MKLYTSLALSMIAAISGFLAFETKAMERVQPIGESIVWIVNNSSSTLEIELKKTVDAGGTTTTTRVDSNGGIVPLGKAFTIASIRYKTYGVYVGAFSSFQPLDFRTPLKEGSDIAFVFSAGETQPPAETKPTEAGPSAVTAPGMFSGFGSYISGLSGYELPSISISLPETGISSYLPTSISEAFSAWVIKVEYLNPGEKPMPKPGMEEVGVKEKGLMLSTNPLSAFSKEVQDAQDLANAQQLKVYRLILKLKTNYALGDLTFALETAQNLFRGDENALKIINIAHKVLLANLKSKEQQ